MCPDGRLGASRTPSLGTETCQDGKFKSISGMKSSLRVIKDGECGRIVITQHEWNSFPIGTQTSRSSEVSNCPACFNMALIETSV
jgi:hypothetical protein